MAVDPSIVFTGINNAFKLAKFCLELKESSEDVRVFGNLINRVRKDRAEAIRRRRETAALLEHFPQKKTWIDGTINDIDDVLFQIGLLLEDARLDSQVGKSVKLQHRFEWVLSVKGEFMVKHTLLATCHQSMLSAMAAMDGLKLSSGDFLVPLSSPEEVDLAEADREPLRPPGLRRKRNKSGSFITYEPVQVQNFADECDEALSQRQSGEVEKGVLISEEALYSPSIPSTTSDSIWDDVDPSEIVKAAANAIERQGQGTNSAPSIALPLREIDREGGSKSEQRGEQRQEGASGRRRKLAAMFADTGPGVAELSG
ncbi:MAG: hypothetical protein M1821_008487 [Bathelium mastoideum]|nr:MAG: hypothetical protein M1821_008487 [Bathelium mastoideum]